MTNIKIKAKNTAKTISELIAIIESAEGYCYSNIMASDHSLIFAKIPKENLDYFEEMLENCELVISYE